MSIFECLSSDKDNQKNMGFKKRIFRKNAKYK